MYTVTIRFYEELNDFLPTDRRKHGFPVTFYDRRSIKDLIESLGVPHPEVDLILVNGTSTGFDYIVRNGDRFSVYPVFECLDISGVSRLRPKPLRVTRFIADVHLGTLARRLRILGFDTIYEKDMDDRILAEVSRDEGRILLTRDRQLLMRSMVSRGLYVRNTDPVEQTREIVTRLDLSSSVRPFSRCAACNGSINKISIAQMTQEMTTSIPHEVLSWCDEYGLCVDCEKIYWRGSHYNALVREFSSYLNPEVFVPSETGPK